MSSGKAWRCSVCLLFLSLTIRQMLRHIYQSHSTKPNFRILCGIDGCPEVYHVFDSFRRHIYRLHRGYMDLDISLAQGENDDTIDVTQSDNSDQVEQIVKPSENDGVSNCLFSVEEMSANLILELRFKELVSQNILDMIVSKGSTLIQLLQENVLIKFENAIKKATSKEDLQSFTEEMREEIRNSSPFGKVKTAYLQKKYISEHFNVVEPQKIILGETVLPKRKSGQVCSNVKTDCFYYIPLSESIQQLLRNDKIFCLISKRKQDNGEFLQDVFDGTFYKKHSLSDAHNTLFLSLYFDDIEICNPLGSKSHKLSMFYYSVLNMPLRYRSKLNSIKLLAVAYRNLIDKYGIDNVLSPFVDELKSLYNGKSFNVNGINETIYVALFNVIGDTPASNLLGGFKEGVGCSLLKCRQCYCKNDLMQSKFIDNYFTSRSLDTHLANCTELERCATKQMSSYLSTLYGINRRSILTEIPEFDVCQNMPEDFMHVFLEGVCQYEIKEVLKYFILEPASIFSINDLNHKMKMFDYGYDDLDKQPTPILLTNLHSNDNRIRQSASQMMVFLKIIPFILSDLVKSKTKHIEFINELIDIYHILFSPCLSLGTLSFFKNLIKSHLINFKNLFPNLNIIPKQHYMIHFPMLMKKFGPACRYWCMRFEAKHKQCKCVASKQNFVNLPLSIAESLQFSESIDNEVEDETHPLFSKDFAVKNCQPVLNEDKSLFLANLQTFYDFDLNEIESVHKTDLIVINSLRYIRNRSYLASEADELLPEFGIIRGIYLINQNQCFFELQMFNTICFEDGFKSYKIEGQSIVDEFVIKTLQDCIDTLAYSSVTTSEGLFIPLKYSLEDLIKKYNTKRNI